MPSGNDWKLIVLILLQSTKAFSPIFSNDLGSVTCDGFSDSIVRLLQHQKANLSIIVSASDNLRTVNPLQKANADSPIVVTELGNVNTPVNPVQL